MSLILFVCTGNLCRSPMATGFLRKRLAEEGLDAQYQVASAGVHAVEGRKASRHATIVMAQRWVDITDHVARSITTEDMVKADLILVMTQDHETILKQTWPQYAWKVRRLSEMAGKRQDIKDPYGGSIGQYESAADTIEGYINDGFERILELS